MVPNFMHLYRAARVYRAGRGFWTAVAALACLLIARPFVLVSAATYDLTPAPPGSELIRVKTVLEVVGSLHVQSAKEVPTPLPLKVHAELAYDQRALAGPGIRLLRNYWRAGAALEVNGESYDRSLRDERQLILLADDPASGRPQFSSPLGPLRREELDLIDVTGSGFPPERLLPQQPVKLDATWEHADDIVAPLLGIGAVQAGHLRSRLKSVTQAMAKIELKGSVKGRVEGTDTEFEVMGNYQFDRRARMVTWLALSLKEKRMVSYLRPGFDVVATVRTLRQVRDDPSLLTDEVLGSPGLPIPPDQLLLEFVSAEHRYRMELDRRWHLVSQPGGAVVLRMVDQGDFLATCQVDALNKLPPGKRISLEDFQADVQHALGSNCEQILEAHETVSSRGLGLLRVVARGRAAGVPIHWIYYHLSNADGRRLSYVFTHEASVGDRFSGHDEALTQTVEFLAPTSP